jgi:N-acetylglucosamine transport system permease protein
MRHGRVRFIVAVLVPALALHAIFVLSPYAQAFYLALTDWTGVSGTADFVGLHNFVRLFTADSLFLDALRNNAIMLVVVPIVTIGIGLFLATVLHLGGRKGLHGIAGARVYKIVYFFPQLLSMAIVAVLWQFVYNPNTGLLNGTLRGLGLGGLARSWLAEPHLALAAVMAVLVWSSAGFYLVLFSAAIESIPAELYEAALLDGASQWASFRYLTLPLLRDTVQVAFVYLGIAALDGFPIVQIMTVGPGGPNGSTEVIGLGLYRNAFTYGKFGYASAMGVTLFFLTLALAVFALRGTRREQVELS